MRRYVRETVTIKYYGSKIQPYLQYGILVYGCTLYAKFLPLSIIQKTNSIDLKKIWKESTIF